MSKAGSPLIPDWMVWMLVAVTSLVAGFILSQATSNPQIYKVIQGKTIYEEVILVETIPLDQETMDQLVLLEVFIEEREEIEQTLSDLQAEIVLLEQISATGLGRQVVERVVTITEEGECNVRPAFSVPLVVDFPLTPVEVGEVNFTNGGDVYVSTWDILVNVDTIIAELEESGMLTAISRVNLTVNGIQYAIPIEGIAHYAIPNDPVDSPGTKPTRRRLYWNPEIGLNVGGLYGPGMGLEGMADVSLSLLSWGNKDAPRWRFVDIGVGLSLSSYSPYARLAPFSYNLGEPLPVVDDLWVTPSVGVLFDRERIGQPWFGSVTIGTTF